ncbi:MAG: hypothetical protein ACP5SH_16480 [Syntrophobacteraceae bacterium]
MRFTKNLQMGNPLAKPLDSSDGVISPDFAKLPRLFKARGVDVHSLMLLLLPPTSGIYPVLIRNGGGANP